ncbi:MAG: AAA family ATPase [Magnetococcus sp. YQC-5]
MSRSRVDSLSVSGFKSIRELLDFKLNNLNVLIGANGSGKSNFIGLFRLLNEIYAQQLQIFVQKQGGPDALLHFGRKHSEMLHVEFRFGSNSYEFDLEPTSDNRMIFRKEISRFDGYYHDHPVMLGTGHVEAKLKNT